MFRRNNPLDKTCHCEHCDKNLPYNQFKKVGKHFHKKCILCETGENIVISKKELADLRGSYQAGITAIREEKEKEIMVLRETFQKELADIRDIYRIEALNREKSMIESQDAMVTRIIEGVGKLLEPKEKEEHLVTPIILEEKVDRPEVPIVLEQKAERPRVTSPRILLTVDQRPIINDEDEVSAQVKLPFKTIEIYTIPSMSNETIKKELKYVQARKSVCKDKQEDISVRELKIRLNEERMLVSERDKRKNEGKWK